MNCIFSESCLASSGDCTWKWFVGFSFEVLHHSLILCEVFAFPLFTGKLFHIDFGYILGRDPKPLPPPMKLNKEMVEGMGGTQSEQYQEFRKQCYTAFLHLRR